MGHVDGQGWRISEVERLTDLSRRDIQRCCYEGKGGVGILFPKEGSWGKRTYDAHDLATLFVVAEYRKRGLTLPQIKGVFEQHTGNEGLRGLLDEEVERCSDEIDALVARYVRARTFRSSLDGDSRDQLVNLFREVAALHAVLHPEGKNLDDILVIPGMDTLVELWFGPGSYERL